MKKVFKLSFLIFAVLLISLVGCKKDKSEDSSSKGKMQQITMKGIVYDTDGKALSNVKITTGTASTTSNIKGEFSFSQAEVVNKRAVIKFEKSGFFTLTRSGYKAGEMFIEAVLQRKGNSDITLETTFETKDPTTLEVPAGMKVKLQAQSIMCDDGTPYTGRVKADMLYLSPNNANFTGMMPGGDLAAIREDNSEVMLISWGMTNVNLTDESGKPLQLKGGTPAEVTYPIPEGMRKNPPASIPLWHFDESKGIWVEDGVATLKDGVYVGNVTHFSWSNLDEPAKRVTVKGKVKYENGKWVKYKKIKVGQTSTITDSEGGFTVFVPENTPTEIEIDVDGEIIVKPVPPKPGGTTIDDIIIIIPNINEEEGEPETADDTDKGSVKYIMEESSFIITFDKNGKLFRHDTYDGDDHEVIIINGDNKTVFVCDDGQNWEDKSEYYDAYASSAQSQILIYKASTYSYQAWPQQPNQNIAGKSCKMYSLGFGSFKMTIGVWNGLVMLLEVPEAIPFMAEAATIKVPAKAFTTECFIPDWFTKK